MGLRGSSARRPRTCRGRTARVVDGVVDAEGRLVTLDRFIVLFHAAVLAREGRFPQKVRLHPSDERDLLADGPLNMIEIKTDGNYYRGLLLEPSFDRSIGQPEFL